MSAQGTLPPSLRRPRQRPTSWRRLRGCLAILVTTLCGCAPEPPEPLMVPAGCQALASEHDCLLPFPSQHFLLPDSSTETGFRFELPEAARVQDKNGNPARIVRRPADGFSPGQQILALFRVPLDDSNWVGAGKDPNLSLAADSPTWLLEKDTLERIPHIAELDPRATEPSEQAMVIRPLVPLRYGARYIVAIHRLQTPGGQAVPPPEGFRRLRDKEASDPALADYTRYENDVFAPLQSAGMDRNALQLAWDFQIRSESNTTGDLVEIQRIVREQLQTDPPKATLSELKDNPSKFIRRRLELRVPVPLFVPADEPLAALQRNEGKVQSTATTDVPFTVWIPNSVASGKLPGRLVQFGHGLFGSRAEADGYLSEVAEELGLVFVAADWWGLSNDDRLNVAGAISEDLGKTTLLVDRIHQAMANFLVVAEVASQSLAELPAIKELATPALFDGSQLGFLGISGGHILGGTYAALAPRVRRTALNVGGANFSMIMFRARPFLAFLAILSLQVPSALEQQKLVSLSQLDFDAVDPLNYAGYLRGEALDGTEENRPLLLQIGIADSSVPNLASQLHARALGAMHLQPAPRSVFGLDTSTGPITGRAYVEYDFGIPEDYLARPATEDNPVHEAVRRNASANKQLDLFFQADGATQHTCQGSCDPD